MTYPLGPGPILLLLAEQGEITSALLEDKARMREALEKYLLAKGYGPRPARVIDNDLQKLVDAILYSD